MKKAEIDNKGICDQIATIYMNRGQGETVFEVVVETLAKIRERVRIDAIIAERTVWRSRYMADEKVVHFTAQEWFYLRGLDKGSAAAIEAARGIEVSSSDRKW